MIRKKRNRLIQDKEDGEGPGARKPQDRSYEAEGPAGGIAFRAALLKRCSALSYIQQAQSSLI